MLKLMLTFTMVILMVSTAMTNEASQKKLSKQLVGFYGEDIDRNFDISTEVDNIIRSGPSLKRYHKSLKKFMSKYLSNNKLKQYLAISS